MDTKLKNYKKNTRRFTIFTVLFTVAETLVLMASVALYMWYWAQYDLEGGNATGKIVETWAVLTPSAIVALLSVILGAVFVGKRNEDGKITLNWFDKIYSEVQIGVGVLGVIAVFLLLRIWMDVVSRLVWFKEVYYDPSYAYYSFGIGDNRFQPFAIEVMFTGAAIIAVVAIEYLLVMSLIKKLKARRFLTGFVCGKLIHYLYNIARHSENVLLKTMGFSLMCVILAYIGVPWIIVSMIAVFIVVPQSVKKYKEVKAGINELKNGNLEYKVPVNGGGELDRLGASVNDVSEALNVAVQNELKNQKMKTDLISNVSHDLRTPLTSMISYVDLLKTEGLDSENAPEYLDIIDRKTRRLQKLTEDLFEAAKASSGAIPVNMEKIDMVYIANQALAEMEERLEENNLQTIFTQKAETAYVMADGQHLWRIIENVLVNASKYALPGSRVYMDIVDREDDKLTMEVKNMSREALNIDANELMERFKRGDESRNTEGSGLGLAIAKDLAALMGGNFNITIDGDLFKVMVALNKAE